MSSPFRTYLDRSIDKLRRGAVDILRSDLSESSVTPLTLYSFTSALKPTEGPQILARGSDIDIGGFSTAEFAAVSSSSSAAASGSSPAAGLPPPENTPQPDALPSGTDASDAGSSHVAFYGNMSLRVPAKYEGKIKSGYAGLRNKKRMALFGEDTWDLSLYTHLRVEVAYRGWEGWRNRWYCNIQTDGPILTDLFQHRLDIPPSPTSTRSTSPLDPRAGPPPTFTTLHLPLKAFILTNSGQTAEHQLEMMSSKVRTVGFSLLGGGRGEEGVPAARTPPSAQQVERMRRLAGAGWGSGDGPEGSDPEVEELLAQDGLLDVEQQKPASVAGKAPPAPPASPAASKYHRVGAASGVAGGHIADVGLKTGAGSVEVTPWSEGYYELCIRSVQAVVHDPLNDM